MDMTNMNTVFIPTEATIVVANVLSSGAGFGVRLDDGTNCYIPNKVGDAVKLTVGAEFTARLVPNRFPDKAERTPWLAVHLSAGAVVPAAPRPVQYTLPIDVPDEQQDAVPAVPKTADRTRALIQSGGVWTVGTAFAELFPGKTRGDGLTDYNTVAYTLRSMFADNQCAKFSMWRSADQSKPSREWYTCYPEKADVDEFEE